MQRDIWESLRRMISKGDRKRQYIIMAGIVFALLLLSMPKKESAKTDKTVTKGTGSSENLTCDTNEIEKKLEKILRKVDGAGDVSVMITYKGTAEKIVEKDEKANADLKEETTVYSDGSDNEKKPYVRMEKMPDVEGVIVVAQGADNAVVVKELTEAVQALFSVDTHKIRIMKGG